MTAAAADVLPPHRALLGVAGRGVSAGTATDRALTRRQRAPPASERNCWLGTTRMPPAAGPTLRTAAHTVHLQGPPSQPGHR